MLKIETDGSPSPAKGYARRKLHTGNPSMQFDEEGMVEKPFLSYVKGVVLPFFILTCLCLLAHWGLLYCSHALVLMLPEGDRK